eukprot:1148990-Pelagomonas_calceolata.AAC.1
MASCKMGGWALPVAQLDGIHPTILSFMKSSLPWPVGPAPAPELVHKSGKEGWRGPFHQAQPSTGLQAFLQAIELHWQPCQVKGLLHWPPGLSSAACQAARGLARHDCICF